MKNETNCCYASYGNHPCDCKNDRRVDEEKETLIRFFEHAPKTEGNPEILGYWTEEGHYVCTDCGASIMARGCKISIKSYVWRGDREPGGDCICCNI